MKFGLRTPSVKKVKSRTTSRVKREIKSAINPFYGKKGMGMINDTKRLYIIKSITKLHLA